MSFAAVAAVRWGAANTPAPPPVARTNEGVGKFSRHPWGRHRIPPCVLDAQKFQSRFLSQSNKPVLSSHASGCAASRSSTSRFGHSSERPVRSPSDASREDGATSSHSVNAARGSLMGTVDRPAVQNGVEIGGAKPVNMCIILWKTD